jgi:hypothetical protein
MSEVSSENIPNFEFNKYEHSLLDKIRMIVEIDFNIPYDKMNRTSQIRFEKQVNRLLAACMLSPENEAYIIDRYNERKHTLLADK